MAAEAFVLPAGTVTFLLTDVEGSSRLWEERVDDDGRRRWRATTRCWTTRSPRTPACGRSSRARATASSAPSPGRPTRSAPWWRPSGALTAELPWLRVRMAVHTGEAQLRDEGNYVGRTIIRCARLRAALHGGQIVVSEATAASLADDAPGDARLIDLGNGAVARPLTPRARLAGRRRRVGGVVPAAAVPGRRAAQPPGAAHLVHRP